MRPQCSAPGCTYLATLIFEFGAIYLCSLHGKRQMEVDRRRHEATARQPVLAETEGER